MKKQKKVLILVLVLSILFSGFAFAISTNGFFEGFSIINIFINGNKAEGDVPAINFHGRTMVPIRIIGEGLGANVQWDGNTSSVYIQNNSSNENIQEDINNLKLYSKIANHYKKIEELGDTLTNIKQNLDVASTELINNYNNNSTELLSQSVYTLNERINWYNDILQPTNDIILQAEIQGIDISDMNITLGNYYNIIDYYKLAIESLSSFSNSKSKEDFENYLNTNTSAFKLTLEQTLLMNKKYNEFFDKLQNY